MRVKIVATGPYAYQSGASSTSQTFVWQRRNDWWANEAARSQARTAVRRRHSQLVEHGRTGQLPGGEHRPLQQLRPEVGDQGQPQDVLLQGPVPPRSEHDVALPEHHEEAAERSAVPPCSRLLDQHEPDPRQGVPGPRGQGEPDRAPPHLEQVGRQEGRREARLLVQRDAGEGRSSLPPATRTRTTTGTSRTRTDRTSRSRSSARTDGRTG